MCLCVFVCICVCLFVFVCVCLCVFVCVWQSVCLYKSGLVVLFDVFKAFLVPSSLFAERRKERDAPDMGETAIDFSQSEVESR